MPDLPPAASPRIVAPTPPQPRPRTPFPVVGAAAPVVMSVAMWLVTGSPLALMFAALGPAIAIANLVDSRVHGSRAARRDGARFEREACEAELEIDDAHRVERRLRQLAAPTAAQIVEGSVHELPRARDAQRTAVLVCLGLAPGPSGVRLEGAGVDRGTDPVARRIGELRDRAAILTDDPVLVSAAGGIAVVGEGAAAEALTRAILVQLIAGCGAARLESERGVHDWLEGLLPARPTPATNPRTHGTSMIVDGIRVESGATIAVLSEAAEVLVRVTGASASLERAPGLLEPREFRPEFLGAEQARGWASALRTRMPAAAALPDDLEFDPHAARRAGENAQHGGRGSLACEIGRAGSGAWVIDLVSMGPHAVVGGTTGSGKSELLVTWSLAMAARYSPRQLTFLFFDFKGGSSFGAAERLPHTVGLVTDLDGAGAQRAIASLAAEVRHRERVLAAAGVRHLDDLAEHEALPRLVVVVDEFAAMAADFPELHTEFGDLAARGRSLGVHLILCTQRPAGIVRDALMANVGLRLSLRVNNSADSVAVIGTPQASAAGLIPGRVLVASGGAVELVQVARSTADHGDAVRQFWTGDPIGDAWSPRRPWVAPLPARVPLESLPAGCFALSDLPQEQRQDPVDFDPARDGNLLVIGASGSGKSTALASIAAANGRGRVLDADVERCWDALAEHSTEALLLDDLDLLVSLYGPEHQSAFLDALAAVMRRGTRRVVVATERWSAAVQSLASLCGARLVLRMPTKQDHIMAGGESGDYDSRLTPGAGWLRGVRVQVAEPTQGRPPSRAMPSTAACTALTDPRLAIVSGSPERMARAMAAAGWRDIHVLSHASSVDAAVVLGDPDTWQRHWPHFTALARERPVLFAGCSLSEVRTLARTRELPPPLAAPGETGWLLRPDAGFARVRLPSAG